MDTYLVYKKSPYLWTYTKRGTEVNLQTYIYDLGELSPNNWLPQNADCWNLVIRDKCILVHNVIDNK